MSSAALDKAKADFDAAAANRAAAGASQSHAIIVSPMTGIVARRLAELGDMTTPGKPLFVIYEPGSLRVTASVPQYRLKTMRSIKVARVEFPELGRLLIHPPMSRRSVSPCHRWRKQRRACLRASTSSPVRPRD